MKQYFKEQLKKSMPCTEEDIEVLNNKKSTSIYNNSFVVGDVLLYFQNGTDLLTICISKVFLRELDQLEKDFVYVGGSETPILERK